MDLSFLHPADPLFWILLLLAGAIVYWVGSVLFSERWYQFLVILRGVVFLTLLMLLLQPVLTVKKERTTLKGWLFFVDNSVSMRYHQTPSLQSINTNLQELFDQLERKDQKVQVFTFADSIAEGTLPFRLRAEGVTTDLGQVVSRIQSEQKQIAGAVLITDGQPTRGEDPLQLVSAIQVPIHVIGVGEATPFVDVAIQSIDVPTVTIKDEPVKVLVTIQSYGQARGRLNASLFKGKKLLTSRYVRVRGKGSQTEVKFQFKPGEIGKIQYRVQLSSLEDEVNIQNNRQAFELLVLKNHYKVALVTGSPNRNTAILKRMLRQQPRLKVDHYIQLNRQRVRPPMKQFWTTPYELILFDNYPIQPLSQRFQRVLGKKLLANKAALGLVVGPNQNQRIVEGLFPFLGVKSDSGDLQDEERPWVFNDRALQLGMVLPNDMEADLPPLKPRLNLIPADERGSILAHFIADSVTLPVAMIWQKGSLRTLTWTTADMASLYYRTTETPQKDVVKTFWEGALAWLLQTGGRNELFFRLNKNRFQQGELIEITGTSPYATTGRGEGEDIYIKVLKQNEKILFKTIPFNLEHRRWQGTFRAAVPGQYQYEILLGDAPDTAPIQQGSFQVMESQVELNQVFLNQNLLQALASKTGGSYFSWSERDSVVMLLEPKEERELARRVTKFGENQGLIYFILFLLSLEWILRRKRGLP
jgi:hypothetical protein